MLSVTAAITTEQCNMNVQSKEITHGYHSNTSNKIVMNNKSEDSNQKDFVEVNNDVNSGCIRASLKNGSFYDNSEPNYIQKTQTRGDADLNKLATCSSNWTFTSQNVTDKPLSDSNHEVRNRPINESKTSIKMMDQSKSSTAPIIKNLENLMRAGNQVFHIHVKVHDGASLQQANNIHQVVIVNPGQNADKMIAQAVGEITKRLKNEATEKAALGLKQEKETIIEITRIANPAESVTPKQSKFQEPNIYMSDEENYANDSMYAVEKDARSLHRRKSAPVLRYVASNARTIGAMESRPPKIIGSQELFRQGHISRSTPITSSSLSNVTLSNVDHHSPATDMTAAMKLGFQSGIRFQNRSSLPVDSPINPRMPFSNRTNLPNPVTTIVHLPGKIPPVNHAMPVQSAVPINNVVSKRTVAILNRNRSSIGSSTSSSPLQTCTTPRPHASRDLSQTPTDTNMGKRSSSLDSVEIQLTDTEDMVSEDGSVLNDSLTNIQWLGHMKGDTWQGSNNKDLRPAASEKQIEKINKECGKNKRPPYSYMHLIQMAIGSTPDLKMTLKDIYTWIERKFPYYRHNPNKGWRNSIRHNLSLYDIFVRERAPSDNCSILNGQFSQNKASTSLWTIRQDGRYEHASGAADETYNGINDEFNDSVFASASPTPSCDSPMFILSNTPSSNDSSRCLATPTPPPTHPVDRKLLARRIPVPLLPKPNAPQTYALIPIQGGVPVVPRQPILVPASWTPNSTYPNLDINEKTRLKRCASSPLPTAIGFPQRKQVRIAPKGPTAYHPRRPGLPHGVGVVMNCAPYLQGSTIATLTNSVPLQLTRPFAPDQDNGVRPPRLHSVGPILTHVTHVASVHERFRPTMPQLHMRSMHMHSYDSGLGQSFMGTSGYGMDSKSDISGSFSLENRKSTTPPTGHGGQGTPVIKKPPPMQTSSLETAILDENDDNGILLNTSAFSESGINDILASIEHDLCSPAKKLLDTPTKQEKGESQLFTSTPVKHGADDSVWISPIRCFPSSEMGGHLEASSTIFSSPIITDYKAKTSTPSKAHHFDFGQQPVIVSNSTMKSSTTFIANGQQAASPKTNSPKLGSLQSFGLVGLTPLKQGGLKFSLGTPGRSPPLDSEYNQSFGRLLGELHLEGMLDEGINLDVSNMSFSHIKCDF